MAGRRTEALAGAVLLTVPLAGCQAGSMGTIGITRTTDGALAAVVARCTSTLARLEVRHGPQDDAARRTVDLTLEAFRPSQDAVVVVPLSAETSGWHRSPTVFTPAGGERYYVVGTDRARGWNTGEVTFVVDDLPELGPDQVLVSSLAGEPVAEEVVTEVVSLERFRKDACT